MGGQVVRWSGGTEDRVDQLDRPHMGDMRMCYRSKFKKAPGSSSSDSVNKPSKMSL